MISYSWTFEIKVDGQYTLFPEVPSLTNRLELSESVFSSFITGKMLTKAGVSLLEDNLLVVGSELRITLSSAVYPPVQFFASVLSINPVAGTGGSTLPLLIDITFISSWYFKQTTSSKAYKGTGAVIISQVLSEIPENFSSVKISQSIDQSSKVAYKTFQSQETFLRTRVLPYTQGALNSSFFMFSTLDNTFQALSYADISVKTPSILIAEPHPEYPSYVAKKYDNSSPPPVLTCINFSMAINKSEKANLRNLVNAKLIALDAFDASLLQDPVTSVLPILGRDNPVKRFSPVRTEVVSADVGYPMMDESLQSSDQILSKALYKYSRMLHAEHTYSALIEPNMQVHAGGTVDFKITKGNNSSSKYSQKLLIVGVSHVIENNIALTTLDLATSSFKYTNLADVTGVCTVDK